MGTDRVEDSTAHPILLYDGVCVLCNRMTRFVMQRDRDRIFRFASLQSSLAAEILARHGVQPVPLDTFYIVLESCDHAQPTTTLLSRSDAVVFVLGQLGYFWRCCAAVLGIVPRPLRTWAYNLVARHRYRIFGRYETCPIPSEEERSRFLSD